MIDNADDLRDKANEFKTGLKKQFIRYWSKIREIRKIR